MLPIQDPRGRSPWITRQEKARSKAQSVSTLPRVSLGGAVRSGSAVTLCASRRDSAGRLPSGRNVAGGYDNCDDHENREQGQRETTTHRCAPYFECESIKRPRYRNMAFRLRVDEKVREAGT
jgi:hypothetical protein